jgi:hypothetical protein
MKKTIFTSLTVIASLSLLTGVLYASPITDEVFNKGLEVKVPQAQAMRTEAIPTLANSIDEIRGTIEKVTEEYMVVKSEDDKLYTVPLFAFLEQEGFEELNLEKGTELIIKSRKLHFANGELGTLKVFNKEEATVEISEAFNKVEAPVVLSIKSIDSDRSGEVKEIKRGDLLEDSKELIEAVPVTRAISITTEEGTELFFAGEITVNGKTIILPTLGK